MFHKTSLKLAGLYLAIIMTISVFFSFSLYNISMREIERGFRRQNDLIQPGQRPGPGAGRQDFDEQRQDILDEARARVLTRIIFVNLAILVGAGALSYYLARRTLGPIEEAHEAQSRFTADASHELRTPITAMKTEIEVTLTDPKLTLKAAKEQLVSNLEELDKLNSLSEGLLRLAQLDASTLPTTKIQIATVLSGAVARIMPLAKKKHITIDSSIPEGVSVTGDATSLQEAFVTIIDNAVKYSPEKSTVTITAAAHKHVAKIEIADTGVGIKAVELQHIFERFYRADSSRTKNTTDGYGLGLAIAQNIIELHQGTISAKSTPGVGTTMMIILPKA